MELTFGEKLLIARKQLDLYQYRWLRSSAYMPTPSPSMSAAKASRTPRWCACSICSVSSRASALTNTNRRRQGKGDAMKIVLAEKVSPATLAVFAAEPGWEV